ncbi:MAG: aminotransferase [Candidatus Riflebacteria bacterium HGW-Riflebacteria-2]|jgi:nicotinamide mononucleotide transporter|nr:MAG: aminotransferase [Candidatus Riflebacteria bacterium HGW-Riflebacteria-2]
MSPIEVVAVIAGFLCVYFTIKENIWCWPTGLLQVTLYIFVFYQAKLYSDVILHVIYVGMNIYGWHFWLHGGLKRKEARITQLSRSWLSACFAGSVAGTLLLGWFMSTRTDAALPYADAFTTVFSLTAQWLLSRKKLENWHFWIAVDVVAIGVYFAKDLYLTGVLYIAFLIMATTGLWRWRRSFLALPAEESVTPVLEPVI